MSLFLLMPAAAAILGILFVILLTRGRSASCNTNMPTCGEVGWSTGQSPEVLSTPVLEFDGRPREVKDPICGKLIHASAAAAALSVGGRWHYFCSARCLRRYNGNPKRYSANLGGTPPGTPTH
ncbi:MAG: YHS domain-containing protein [Phycisphaerales bacterium]|nr:YHS domain-containing protein [Phycisphaerales bacterium]